jgi:hypothetical protein
VFGISLITALAISAKVERAVLSSDRPAEPPVTGREEIGDELQAIQDQLRELEALGRDLAALEETLDHARARIQEWTA